MVLEQRSPRPVAPPATVSAVGSTTALEPVDLLPAPELECGFLYRVVFDDTPFGGFRAKFVGWEPSRLGEPIETGRVAAWDNGIRLVEGNWRVERVLTPPGVGGSDVAA